MSSLNATVIPGDSHVHGSFFKCPGQNAVSMSLSDYFPFTDEIFLGGNSVLMVAGDM